MEIDGNYVFWKIDGKYIDSLKTVRKMAVMLGKTCYNPTYMEVEKDRILELKKSDLFPEIISEIRTKIGIRTDENYNRLWRNLKD